MILILIIVLFFSSSYGVEKCGFNKPYLDINRSLLNCTTAEMQKTILSDNGHFFIHYDTSGTEAPDLTDNDNDGIPDYINSVAEAADSSYTLLVEQMNFIDGANGNDNITNIFVLELGGSAYGWTRKMDSNCDETCIEIDNNYSESNYFTHGIPAMQVTLLHEYFHTIQLDYRCNFGMNSYFYELTSTWIEDVGFPDVDDYLSFMTESTQSSNYYKNPELDFEDTNGYSVAWFGHFLSTQYGNIEGITHLDELESITMKKIWERIGSTGSSALNVIDYILGYEYNSSFIEAWVEFNSRNLFNQLDDSLYYYQDQSLIGPIITPGSIEIEESMFSNNYILTNSSVKIPSFNIYQQGILDIIISSPNGDYSGYLVVKSDTGGSLYPIFTGNTGIISEDEKIYLILNSENSSLTVNLSLTPSYTPLPPLNIWALTAPDYIDLWWEPSPGPGDTLSYIILRDGDFLNSTSDTLYTDESVADNTAYEYSIAALSNIGISELISISTNTAEPDYPVEPEEFLFLPDWDKINLWWNISSGPGTSLSYIIYRNEDSLTTLEDTSYMDINVSSSQTYKYDLFAINRIGKSLQPATIQVTTWPSPESINKTELLFVYPNPVKTYSSTGFSVIVDSQNEVDTGIFRLYDVSGREISYWNNIIIEKGRQRVNFESNAELPLASGIYYISFQNTSNDISTLPIILID